MNVIDALERKELVLRRKEQHAWQIARFDGTGNSEAWVPLLYSLKILDALREYEGK